MDLLLPIIKYAFTALIIGGGLWKGLEALARTVEAVSNAFKLRAEASIAHRRLEDEQIRENYHSTLELVKIQGERINSLQKSIIEIESHYKGRENGFRDQIENLIQDVNKLRSEYMKLSEKNMILEREYSELKKQHEDLMGRYDDLKKINDQLRARIRKLEKVDNDQIMEARNEPSS